MRKKAIGLMTGTSLDGIDVVMAYIDGTGVNTEVEVINSHTYEYDSKLLLKVKQAMDPDLCNAKLICSLNYELAQYYSKCVFAFCLDYNIDINEIDYIASHGQTIYHIAEDENGYSRSSLQLGDGSVLANLTGVTVVSNFRNADIAHGGEGAPLVPYAHYILFKSDSKSRIIQNIGGISNLTFIPKNGDIESVIAFDNGPGNMMIDYAMEVLYKKPYDYNGEIAKKGQLIKELFNQVVSHKYFNLLPPKSTGRELFGIQYTDTLIKQYSNYPKEDIISTLTHITAYTIAKSYKDFILKNHNIDEVIVSGGGAHNQTLLRLINEYSNKESVHILEDFGYKSDDLEALAFIILGNETLSLNPSNVPKATGAKKQAILGQVTYVSK
jgi:anhydro-N-acetylmuramic acid kinase